MESQVTEIILSMQGPFTFQELRQRAQKSGIEDQMAILSVMSQLGEKEILKTYHYVPNEKNHRYVVKKNAVEPN